MGIAVRVTRDDFTAADLRAASAKCVDGAQVRRILALALCGSAWKIDPPKGVIGVQN